jgi:hypothetical protein
MKPLARCVGIILSGLLLTALRPAYSASFGRTTAGVIPSAGLRADFKRGSRFVLAEQGTANRVCAWLDARGNGGTGVQSVRMALYRDRNGAPAELLLETGQISLQASQQQPADWYCAGSPAVPLAPGTYWIVIHSGGDPGIIRYFYDGAANWYGNADTYADGSADTFGAGGAGEGTISIRVDYLTDSDIHVAGRRTVGSQVSSPMSSQFKRGSSFELTEKAQLRTINAYVDGLGGASGQQTLTLALYDDVNGEPAGLVTQGTVTSATTFAGSAGHWVTVGPQSPIPLMPGRYWIVLQTNGDAGVLRYYLDGQSNWRGNANAGASPSPIFGPAGPGDGTISAYITYEPANIFHSTFGRTTPGALPSKGLSANYIRGSGDGPAMFTSDAYLTALWAYVDGNGGAAGSQKLRLVLYNWFEFDPMTRVAESAEVTIAAGTPPGWVRFAVPYTRIFFESYYIMMLSGGNAGVARNYGGNEPDRWLGEPASYTNAPGILYLENNEVGQPVLQRGSGVISMYAEYVTLPSQ